MHVVIKPLFCNVLVVNNTGDIGFDPLGLKPDNFEDFSAMSTKELQNGRLAMLAVAGIVAQELVNGKEIFVNFGLAPDTFDPSTLPIKF